MKYLTHTNIHTSEAWTARKVDEWKRSTCAVVNGNHWRWARTHGGHWSRSGLTLYNVFVEDSAVVVLSRNQIASWLTANLVRGLVPEALVLVDCRHAGLDNKVEYTGAAVYLTKMGISTSLPAQEFADTAFDLCEKAWGVGLYGDAWFGKRLVFACVLAALAVQPDKGTHIKPPVDSTFRMYLEERAESITITGAHEAGHVYRMNTHYGVLAGNSLEAWLE